MIDNLAMRSDPAFAPAVLKLRLTDFRNYASASLDLDRRPVTLSGPNGAGKTNVLEALSFLAPGRGLRRAAIGDVSRRDPADDTGDAAGHSAPRRWAVAATLAGRDGDVAIGTGPDPDAPADGGAGRRAVRIDGAPAKTQAMLGEMVTVTWMTPEMDRLFVEAASDRRRFLDRLVLGLDPSHGSRTNAYDRALRDRNRLLRDRPAAANDGWLSALEQRIAETGIAVAAARADTVARLAEACRLGIGPFPAAGLTLAGEVDDWLRDGPAIDAEDRLRQALADGRARDAEAGRTLSGPHRSDLAVHHLTRGVPAAECSTGEQKALLISIVLAHARVQAFDRGTLPILLLDEVAAHLDATRRAALFDEICDLGAQAWMTGTDSALFEPLGARGQHFHVDGAAIEPVTPTGFGMPPEPTEKTTP